MAIVTGDVDALECVLRKIGIDDSEFTAADRRPGACTSTQGNGARCWATTRRGPSDRRRHMRSGSPTDAGQLRHRAAAVLGRAAAERAATNNPPLTRIKQNIVNYTNAGGRVFATHYSYSWLYQHRAGFTTTANGELERRAGPTRTIR